jgi:solute carrier family 25 S-adenosylmethionine transporter 26
MSDLAQEKLACPQQSTAQPLTRRSHARVARPRFAAISADEARSSSSRRRSAAKQPAAASVAEPAVTCASPLDCVLVCAHAAPAAAPALSLRHLLGSAAAGALAGAAVETALYPIDTIKTRLQAAKGGAPIVWHGLYKGLAGNIFGVIPASALFMGVYEPLKRLALEHGHSPLAAQLCAATVAGTAASLVRVPTEVVKQRMQMGQFPSAVAAVRTILLKEGLRKGLYAGYGSFMLRDLPFDAIEFVAYEQMRSALRAALGGRQLSAFETSAVGAAAGVATAVLTTPLDVVKTRLMTQGAGGAYKGVLDCFARVVREEGPRALFRGVQPRVLWIGMGGSVFFTCLEGAKKLMGVDTPAGHAH